jgi:4-amino-4-deoxy-L-arabinose transferase-like glycosyltransferase
MRAERKAASGWGRWTSWGALSLLLLFWLLALHNLTIYPPIYEDEPWLASTGWKLATDGRFGTELFRGYYHMEERYYGFMPVFPLLSAVVFRLGGIGLFQARLVAVAMGLLTLALTYSLGRRLFGAATGWWALVFLLGARLTGPTPSLPSGILLFDVARLARYDIAVPVFGLASLHAFWRATGSRPRANLAYGAAGLLAGLAGLSHLYGLFWLAALLALAVWERRGWGAAAALLIGFSLPWILYLLYVAADPTAFAGQVQDYAPRFGLLDPRWYLDNVAREPGRYGPGLGRPGWGYLSRPGFWLACLVLPAAVVGLARRAITRSGRGERLLLGPLLVLPLLFALLIYLKLANYLVTIAPLAALAGAWLAVRLWRGLAGHAHRRLLRPALVLAALALILEAGATHVRLVAVARQTTPYAELISEIRASLTPGSRVLGLHNYWLGLEDIDFRSWYVPIVKTNPDYWRPPLTLGDALDEIAPQAVLLDSDMAALFTNRPDLAAELSDWLARRGFNLVAVIVDPTYGRFEIFTRPPES